MPGYKAQPSPSTRIKAILTHDLAPWLGQRGFVQEGPRFVRRFPSLEWLIELQVSRFSRSRHAELTFNCGIFVHGFGAIYTDVGEPLQRTEAHSCVRSRLGMLREPHHDLWWTVDENDGPDIDRVIATQVLSLLEHEGLPFFSRFKDLDDVVAFLQTPRLRSERHIWPKSEPLISLYRGIVLHLAGCQAEACEAVSTAQRLCRISETKEDIGQILQRILCI